MTIVTNAYKGFYYLESRALIGSLKDKYTKVSQLRGSRLMQTLNYREILDN